MRFGSWVYEDRNGVNLASLFKRIIVRSQSTNFHYLISSLGFKKTQYLNFNVFWNNFISFEFHASKS